ncbi:hypothetical protein B296_00021772 [Ensete ventricosum]|uniref:Uncharacterized protein n=1 Tax=Ensete ventricosum TaxID=4639 RepID=A0A427AM15_ENSVE|nr:hypothetical protein B296_00021772 [Ensete ventricosum]
MDHHIVSATGGGTREDKVGGSGDKDTQEDDEGPSDHCVPSLGLVDAHLLEAGPEALELVVNVGEVCVRRLAK